MKYAFSMKLLYDFYNLLGRRVSCSSKIMVGYGCSIYVYMFLPFVFSLLLIIQHRFHPTLELHAVDIRTNLTLLYLFSGFFMEQILSKEIESKQKYGLSLWESVLWYLCSYPKLLAYQSPILCTSNLVLSCPSRVWESKVINS